MATDLINMGAYPADPLLGDTLGMITPDMLNQPANPALVATQPQATILPKPSISEMMLAAGVALMSGGNVGNAIMAMQNQQQLRREEERQARKDRLSEFELLGRIRDRQLAERETMRKLEVIDRLKKENPDLAPLIDLDPSEAAKALAKKTGAAGGPFEGTSMEAQDANVLLTGDPSSAVYASAYNRVAQPKMSVGQDGTPQYITPDMSAYRVPTFNAQQSPPAAAPVVESGMTTPAAPVQGAAGAVSPVPAQITPPAVQAAPQPAYGPKGGITMGEGSNFGSEKATTAGYANRMIEASKILDSLPPEAKLAKTGTAGKIEGVLSAIPSFGLTDKIGGAIVKGAATPDQQLYMNAAQEWIRAKLRKESGAVIGAQEMIDEYATYFPTPLDGPKVIKQKEQLRKEAEKSMVATSGGAYKGLFSGQEAPKAPKGMLDDEEPQYTKDNPARPKTQAEFDALPSGTPFINPADGKLVRKK